MHTIASVAGTAIQMPVRPRSSDSSHAMGMMSMKPLSIDTANASFGRSEELRKAAATILIPEKNRLIK